MESPESLVHLFVHCNKVKGFWNEVEERITCGINIPIRFTASEILLGYLNPVNSHPINKIILVTNRYIFTKSRSSSELMKEEIKRKVKHVYKEQRQVSQLNLK